MGAIEDKKRYGWCVRTRAWVPRDAMLGAHIKLFHANGSVEQVTVRLHPDAHAMFAEEIRAMAWTNDLRTRVQLEEGDPILDVSIGDSDTAEWYATQAARSEDDALVAQALLRPLLRARDMDDLMRRASEVVSGKLRRAVPPEAWVAALRELAPKIPRWDAGVIDFASWPLTPEGFTDREEHLISADTCEVVALVVKGDEVHVERFEHDDGERVMRALGKIREEPVSLTR